MPLEYAAFVMFSVFMYERVNLDYDGIFGSTAAAMALDEAVVEERTVDVDVSFLFEYPFMNDVMRIVKEEGPDIIHQGYDTDCLMTLRIRRSQMRRLRDRLAKVDTLRFVDESH